jgi:hypothetical protein
VTCNDFDSLNAEYRSAERQFTSIVTNLRAANSGRTAEYTRLATLSERAKTKAEAARRALRNHIIEHGCC